MHGLRITQIQPNGAHNLGSLQGPLLLINELIRVDIEGVLINDLIVSPSHREGVPESRGGRAEGRGQGSEPGEEHGVVMDIMDSGVHSK